MTSSVHPFDLYRTIKARLAKAGFEVPELEVRILFEDLARLSPIQTRFSSVPLTSETVKKIEDATARLEKGEPIGRILGYRDFWKHRFYLSPETLEPRPDTETLVEAVLKGSFPSPGMILDLGTGTGCILLSLLHEFPDARGVGVDISEGACRMAQENADRLEMTNRVEFFCGSWMDPLPKDCKYDLIVSNPPYIPSGDIPNLPPEVRNYDPIQALDGGKDGLDPYTNLLPILKNRLAARGHIFFECGIGQADEIVRLGKDSGATLIRVTRDLCGVPRVVEISYGDK